MVVVLTSAVLPMALIVEASEPVTDHSKYDYSKPDSQFNQTVSAADLVEYIMRQRAGSENFTVSDAEREYLETYSDFKIQYDRILRDYIKVVSIEANTVKISAEIYSYTVNGKQITWKPVKAYIVDENNEVIPGIETEFQPSAESKYIITFKDVTVNEDTYSYRVDYEIDGGIAVDEEDANRILDLAFNFVNGEEGIKAPLDFYATHEYAIIDYYTYLAEKSIYDQNKAEYDAYLEAYAKYEQDLEDYNNYEERLEEYQTIKDANAKKEAEYNAAVEKYNAYLVQLAFAEKQIENLNVALFTKLTYLDRQLYSCLFSPLVDEVVGKKQEMIALKPKLEGPIDDCAKASAAIQKIFRPSGGVRYDDLKTIEDKYTFYVNNYDALRANILLLGESLYKIYTTSGIRALMHTAPEILGRPDYTEKLSIFIGQLLSLSDALYDESMTYTDGSGKSHKLSDIKFSYWNQAGTEIKNISIPNMFENKEYVKDTNDATPISLSRVNKPVEPQYQELPVEPDAMSKPAEPARVIKPIEPVEVSAPSGLPEFDWVKFLNDEKYREILTNVYETFKNGSARSEVSENVIYAPAVTLERAFKAVYVDVKFYGTDGNEIPGTAKRVEKGSYVSFNGQIPTKAEDITATYEFYRWVTANGTPYDLYSVNESVSLYPEFAPAYKAYDMDNGRLVLESNEELERLPLTHYTEVMRQNNLSTLRITASNATVVLKYKDLTTLERTGITELDFDIQKISSSEYSCKITAYNSNGNEVSTYVTVQVYMPCLNTEATVNGTIDGGLKIDIYSGVIYSGNYFNATIGQLNELSIGYTIRNSYRDLINIQKLAAEGEIVEFTVDVPAGMTLEIYYILNSQEYPITGNSFVMPGGNIRLGARLTDILYTIKFEIDGKVAYEKSDYKYGSKLDISTLKSLQNPTKVNDDKYSYKFIGWSPEISETVTCSVTYVAQFEATLLPVQAKQINWWRVAVVSAITLFIMGVVAIVLFILNKKKVISIKGIILVICKFFKGKKGNVEQTENDPVDNATEDTVLENDSQEEMEQPDAEKEEKSVCETTENDTAEE
jgi:hypothetical protein